MKPKFTHTFEQVLGSAQTEAHDGPAASLSIRAAIAVMDAAVTTSRPAGM